MIRTLVTIGSFSGFVLRTAESVVDHVFISEIIHLGLSRLSNQKIVGVFRCLNNSSSEGTG